LAIVGSVGRNVPSVAERPGRPKAKDIVGVQVPNSEAAVRAEMCTGMDTAEAVAAKRERKRVAVCILEKG
jgi:hypothetical protein